MATLVKQGGGFLWVAVVLLAGWEGSSDQRDGTKWWVGWIGRVGDGVEEVDRLFSSSVLFQMPR